MHCFVKHGTTPWKSTKPGLEGTAGHVRRVSRLCALVVLGDGHVQGGDALAVGAAVAPGLLHLQHQDNREQHTRRPSW